MMQVGVLMPQNFRLLSIAAILDVFDTVNGFYKKDELEVPFNISLITLGDTHYSFSTHPRVHLESTGQLGLILVPSFASPDIKDCINANNGYIPWLNKQYAGGAEIATFCTGAFLLAASGLLNGKTATTHVDACSAFSTAFPLVHLKPDKTVTQDGRLFTSGGATSTFHLLLHLLQLHCGKDLAIKVAKIFAIDMDRITQSYFSTFQPVRHHNDDIVASAQEKIENNYQDIATIEEMIKDIPSSRRNIVRRFKQVIGMTPIEYLQQTRIEAAKKLLEQTAQQMTEVIYNSGYNDPKAFRKVFRKSVGMTPTQYRDKFQPK
ncbi:Transcriptional regulator GlxA family, contains an amidase domain and an AraC-type DNA-binding HTH domain [Pedobacter terrae]|uniref:Transcriptional regulator GlxA family, contains an amidase domain and an AraC-type DNA-binding HTH domain n=1 Tax=Pedobacter terrae TaxID=405671 RepID=A0A1G8AXJ9_9SPHI|nr:helix-turn-helix domain-containing protein [Pedobacter terrae]SDH25564.1 Transcriptional regulator GlxA family, contains an amidase domain and an AraC-type DNA-binding HTH domain [Pedobacter terrae]